MRRVHLVELSDLEWFPRGLRYLETEFLNFLFSTFHIYRPAAGILADALHKTGCSQIVDLASGCAGPLVGLRGEIEQKLGGPVRVTLTDKFPHLDAWAELSAASSGGLTAVPRSVDAVAVPHDLSGFRTLFTSFHHFHEEAAVKILRDAALHAPGIAVFEITERRLATILREMMMPLNVVLLAPFIRPMRGMRLFFTYVVPVLPIVLLWGGIISDLRSYTAEELAALAAQADRERKLSWTCGRKRTFLGNVTYLIGARSE